VRVRAVHAPKPGQELPGAHLQVARQRQRAAVGLLDLDPEEAEDDVRVEPEEGIDVGAGMESSSC
jgi:hypothetical protein